MLYEFPTKYMQISSGADWRHAAATEGGLAFVVATIAHHRAEDGQSALEITQTAGHQHAVFTPCNA